MPGPQLIGNAQRPGEYYGSLPHALAERRVGRQEGYSDGHADGLAVGYEQGIAQGREQGQNEMAAIANQRLEEANGYIRQHLADKEALQRALNEQTQLLDRLEARLRELEAENSALKDENVTLRKGGSEQLLALVDELRAKNQELQAKFDQLQADYEAKNQQWVDQLWEYNRAVVCLNTMRNTIEQIALRKSPEEVHEIAEIFSAEYDKEIEHALQKGAIAERLETDKDFAANMPRTHHLLMSLLHTANPEASLGAEYGSVDDWVPSGS